MACGAVDGPVTAAYRTAASASAVIAGTAVAAGATGVIFGHALHQVAGNRMAPWIIGRAAGVCAYLLLVGLTVSGLVLAHPWRTRMRWPSNAARIRIHAGLAAFTGAFTVLHIVVLATDRYAGVGALGAILPMHAAYRPLATTFGLLGLWCGLLAGVTAACAGRLPMRLWWPIHKIAAVAFGLVWVHGVFAGGDTPALKGMYAVTVALVLLVAVSRYTARTAADRLDEVQA